MTEPSIDTHGKRIQFGKHAGELWTRLPVSYLRWMVNQDTRDSDFARSELDRRGIPVADHPVEISAHAIDSASLRLAKYFQRDHDENEGLHAWLCRKAVAALNHHEPDAKGRIHHDDVRFVFEFDAVIPILKTCMWKAKKHSKQSQPMRQSDTTQLEKRP